MITFIRQKYRQLYVFVRIYNSVCRNRYCSVTVRRWIVTAISGFLNTPANVITGERLLWYEHHGKYGNYRTRLISMFWHAILIMFNRVYTRYHPISSDDFTLKFRFVLKIERHRQRTFLHVSCSVCLWNVINPRDRKCPRTCRRLGCVCLFTVRLHQLFPVIGNLF